MPDLVAHTNMDAQAVSRLREELSKMTQWLAKRIERFSQSTTSTQVRITWTARRQSRRVRKLFEGFWDSERALKVIDFWFLLHGIGVCADGDRQVCHGGITVRVRDMVCQRHRASVISLWL
jgi:hypothetical protein